MKFVLLDGEKDRKRRERPDRQELYRLGSYNRAGLRRCLLA